MNSVKGNVKKLTAAEAKARVKAATASFIIDNVCNWSNHNGYPMKINRESKITRFLVKNKKWEDAPNRAKESHFDSNKNNTDRRNKFNN